MEQKLRFPDKEVNYALFEQVTDKSDIKFLKFSSGSSLENTLQVVAAYPDKEFAIVEQTIVYREVNQDGTPKD